MAHVMNAFTNNAENLHTWIDSMKNVDGYNVLWLFGDYWYDANPRGGKRWGLNFMDSAALVGMPVLVGNQSKADTLNYYIMLLETWNHPALFRYKGMRVYEGYDYTGEWDNGAYPGRHAYPKSSYYYWVTPRYAERQGGPGSVWFNYHKSYPNDVGKSIEYIYDSGRSSGRFDGIINFPVALQNDLQDLGNLRRGNLIIAKQSASSHKAGIVGINHNYSSAAYVSYGFKSTLNQVKDILAIRPLSDWPLGICDVTCNDYVERSAMSRPLVPVVNGLAFIPPLSAGFNLGDNTPYPVVDGSGIQKFIRPWIEKFKHTDTTPVTFSTDEIFYWYVPHRRDAPFITTIPSFLAEARPASVNGGTPQQWWNHTMYHGPNAGTGDSTQEQHVRIRGIKKYQDGNYYNIRMACHLRAPAYLEIEINGVTYRSGKQTGPDGYFEISQVQGTPAFRIVDENKSVRKTYTAHWAISDKNVWPFGWQPLIQKAP